MISFENTMNIPKSSDNPQEQDEDQEELLKRAKEASSLGRSFMVIDDDRKYRKLNEIYNLEQERELVTKFMPNKFDNDSPVNIEEVNNAEDKALGLAIVTASQLLKQKEKPISINENSSSLVQLIRQLGKSSQLLEKLNNTRPDDVELIMKKILLAKGIKEEAITERHIEELKDTLLQARKLLIRKDKALKGYLRR